ncbi:hypothetical protein GA417_14275 [Poseidonibacter ostreae]|uniref:hypothetical protein n=1 Tax=Poseidonibacter ostreae TaxID=2654171 RepID=UPI0012656D5C|nr:hypothetical protein [Poseidonibacter ostreae]KAB7881208.1 hypothetical protein GA417_14275 [Poseidonibacter ostreae]
MENKAKDLIYHYTDITALKSILTTDKLWMTSHRFLNDAQEFEEGYAILKKSIDECLTQNDAQLKQSTKNVVNEMLGLLKNTIVLFKSWRPFVSVEKLLP